MLILRVTIASVAVALTTGCAAAPVASLPAGAAPPTVSRQLPKASAAVARLRADLTAVFTAPIMARGRWGVDIRSLDTGERLFDLNPDRLMMPASNMKIVTLAAAADALGWDYVFTTTLETTAPVKDGVLQGDLIVRGGGDPTINSRGQRAAAVLDEWVAALRSAGIHRIDGRIIGDDQRFDDEGIGPGWAWDYLQFGYAAPVGALQFNENLGTLTIRPAVAGQPAQVSLTPGAGLTLINRVATVADAVTPSIDYRRRLDQPVLEVTGSIGADTATLERAVAVVNPTIFFAQSLKDGLVARGIEVSGSAVDLDDVAAETSQSTAERRTIVATSSPPLREIATVLMKVSQNLYAETLIKAIGGGRDGLGTFDGGLNAVRTTLTSWGIPADSFVNADGSGLSRYNYLAPSTVTAILERIYHDDRHRARFIATLPIAGKEGEGTMATRMRRTRAAGNAAAKTGSISNVRALSGYVRTRDGEMLVFSILANDFVIPAATVNWITDLAVEHLANFTRK